MMPTDDVLTDDEMDELLRDLVAPMPRSRSWERQQRNLLISYIESGPASIPPSLRRTHVPDDGYEFTHQAAASEPGAGNPARWRWMTAAAALIVVVTGLVVSLRWRETTSSTPSNPGTTAQSTTTSDASQDPEVTRPPNTLAQGPLPGTGAAPWPSLFPALAAGDERNATVQMGVGQIDADNAPSTSALVARIDGDRMLDGVRLTAMHRSEFDSIYGSTYGRLYDKPTDVTVDGVTAAMYRSSGDLASTVVILPAVNGVNLAVAGRNAVTFIELAGRDVASATEVPEGNGFELGLTIGDLPDGYTVVVPPEPMLRGAYIPTMNVGPSVVTVEVRATNPLLGLALSDTLERVDVGETPGWLATQPAPVLAWQVAPGVWAEIHGGDKANTVSLATSIEFVDEPTWRSRYPNTNEFFIDPTSTPVTR